VEAGVDLDFRWAIRDYGPFDSIIQVAGRCNRHGGKNPGTVVVAKFVNDNGRSFASMVYSSALLNAMDEIASERAEFNEDGISPLIDRYYTLVTNSIKGSGLWQKITEGSWTDLPPLYQEPDTGTVALIIEREGLREVINRLFNEKWSLEKLETRKALLNKIQQHTIEIPLRTLPGCREVLSNRFLKEGCGLEQLGDTNMWLLSEEASDMLYHKVTGFMPPSKQGDDIGGLFM
jgi:CRISPR-associated endonuclease/helicase Cas3